ncbi:MAG: cytochrome c biogenesis protein ResB [Mariprofundus sp.]|nr:cytochrome c biogenesis protein ResB [Mariprofundus sp.]
MTHRGVKQQAFGVVLVSLGVITALLSKVLGFELDVFYIVIGIIGVCLFLYGLAHKNRDTIMDSDLFKALSSMSLAIIMLMVVSIASVIGTVLLQNQNQAAYLDQFGPLWYWVFRSLGLFNMYHTWWFLMLLGLLMLSLTACLWRHVPGMLKQMRTRHVFLDDHSLTRFKYLHQATLEETHSTAALEKQFRHILSGWEFKTAEQHGQRYIRADKGRWSKWGYILVHSSILIILIGGWMSLQFGIRGNMSVTEGTAESKIFFLKGGETATLDMPFQVRCNSFHINFFPTGMPKEFRSNLTIIDQGKEMLTSDIIVNEPLYYKGVRIYQSSFGDGGSDLVFTLFPMEHSGATREASIKVYETWTDPNTGITLKITDFKPYNVQNLAEAGKAKVVRDIGPAVEYEIRGPGLQAAKIKAFINPFIDIDGKNQGSFLMLSTTGHSADYQAVGLGLDLTNPVEWKLFRAFKDRMQRMAKEKRRQKGAGLAAFKAALTTVFGDSPPENAQAIAMRVLQAAKVLPQLPWPVLPMLKDYHHVYYTGLQIARDPGMNVVWFGSALLVIGLCIMLYMPHHKLWLVIRPDDRQTHITLIGLSSRNPLAFHQLFHNLAAKL